MVFSNEFATVVINYNTVDRDPPRFGRFTPRWMRAWPIESGTRFGFHQQRVGQAFLDDISIIVSGKKAGPTTG
jgi:hypothetical protein